MSIQTITDLTMINGAGPAVSKERRRADRVQEAVGIQIIRLQDKLAAGEDCMAQPSAVTTLNSPTHKCSLSSVGMAFAHDLLMRPGELITIHLTLFPSARSVQVDGRIVSANDAPEISDGDKPTYRIAFESISDEDRDFIEIHVQDLMRQRPSID